MKFEINFKDYFPKLLSCLGKISLNIFFGLIVGILIVNKYGFELAKNWKIEYHDYVINYLKIFLSLPAVTLLIAIIFFCKFKKSINFLIKHLIIKYKDIEATTQQSNKPKEKPPEPTNEKNAELITENEPFPITKQPPNLKTIPEISKSNSSRDKDLEEISKLKEENQKLLESAVFFQKRSNFFEFRDLDRILVQHTKDTLLFLNKVAPIPISNFINSVILVPKTVDKIDVEKASIFEILITSGLISNIDGVVTVTEKGKIYIGHLEKTKNNSNQL